MSRGKILVVDDETIVGMAIQEQLQDAGYEVVVVEGGRLASDLVQKEQFQLAFIDLWMPDMDGVETCKAIRQYSPGTKIVLISGRPDGFAGREGDFIKAGGLDLFLYKPFLEGELLRVTEKILG